MFRKIRHCGFSNIALFPKRFVPWAGLFWNVKQQKAHNAYVDETPSATDNSKREPFVYRKILPCQRY